MQPCRVCQHRKVKAINQQLLDGVSLRTIGKQFDLTKDSLSRHWHSNHSSHTTPRVYWLDFTDVSPDGELPSKEPLTVRFWTGPRTARKVIARYGGVMLFFSPAPFPWVTISNSLYDAKMRAYFGKQLAFTCPECEGEVQRLYFVNEATAPRKRSWLTCCERCLSGWQISPNARQAAALAAIATATEIENNWTEKRETNPLPIKEVESVPVSAAEEWPQARQEWRELATVKKDQPENIVPLDLASHAGTYSETDAEGVPCEPAPLTLEEKIAELVARLTKPAQPQKADSQNWDWRTPL